ncbi:uncharacterized protein A1O5_01765 [Cladophialophora psammophila CBS 110553]|uniref:Cytochrome P450 oxidoreductase n=1 Tax=Cladophialophora psammophila CBS 110553 TaxID=1182543 RepID=W9XXS0_9EURO|nr:uncharacterized protein A1O5_01765 [Cladophialophora psammophila CBS 110553]EXJ75069.1 hypothetical protein A1O5_01765 [Cladophialophora psammophila CBS 110553]
MKGKLLAMYDNSMGNFNSLAGLPSAIKDHDWTIHSVFLLAGAVLFIWYTVSTVRAYWRLREFQGPPLAAFTNLWYAKAVTTYKLHLILGDVCTEYGSLARIGPNTLLTCDVELIRRINAARSTYHRGDWYRAFKFDAERENLLSEPDEVKHVEMRKKVAAGYAGKDNPTLERDMDDILWQLITLIKDRYISNGSSLKKFDLAAAAQYFTGHYYLFSFGPTTRLAQK